MSIPEHNVERPSLDATRIRFDLMEEGVDVTTAEVEAELAKIDLDAEFDAARAEWEVVEWDHQTPINGVPAEQVHRRRRDVDPDTPVYLLVRDGRVVVFQPHLPGVPGFVRIDDPQSRGSEHADEVAVSQAAEAAIQKVREALARNRARD